VPKHRFFGRLHRSLTSVKRSRKKVA
jgi:hypothetical protein